MKTWSGVHYLVALCSAIHPIGTAWAVKPPTAASSSSNFSSAAITGNQTTSSSALKELTNIIKNNNGQVFSGSFPQLRAINLDTDEAAKVAEIIIDVKRSLTTFRERSWLLNLADNTDTRRLVSGQYAHYYLNFYVLLTDITSQNILGKHELTTKSDLPIKIAVIEQAIAALEQTLVRKPNGETPGALYGWWSSSDGFNEYAEIDNTRVEKLKWDLWNRYNELIRQYNTQNPRTPLPLAPLPVTTATSNVMSMAGVMPVTTMAPSMVNQGYTTQGQGYAIQGMTAAQLRPYLMSLSDTQTPQLPNDDGSTFQSRVQQLLQQTNDPEIRSLLNLWAKSNAPILSPNPQTIIAQASAGISPLNPSYYQAAMMALNHFAANFPNTGFLIVRRGAMILQQTLQQQQMKQNNDYTTIQNALNSGRTTGQWNLPQNFSQSIFNSNPESYSQMVSPYQAG